MTSSGPWKIGAVTVTPVVEMEATIPGTFVLPDAEASAVQEIPWLCPHFADADGNLAMRIQLLVIGSGDRLIAVDTCVGNDKERTNPFWNHLDTPFLATLDAAGFAPERFDTVICTHLHIDHVGWNTRWTGSEWVPTFPNARYLFNQREYEHWKAFGLHEDGDVQGDSVEPIVRAGLADLTDDGYRVNDEIRLIPTNGHSPGHQSVVIESLGERAIITGDLMHHPAQCARPEWPSAFDSDVEHARRTRREFLAEHAGTTVLVIGTHFASPTAGHIVAAGDAYEFSVG